MSEFVRCLVGMFAVIAPLGAMASLIGDRVRAGALPHGELRVVLGAPAVAFTVLAASAAISGPVLDWLDVSPESFQFAAGAAMFPLALRLILLGDSASLPERTPAYAWAVPLAVPVLAGPSSIIASISYAARFGEGEAILASAIVLAATAAMFAALHWLDRLPLLVVQAAARLSGGLLVLIAVELAVDGVQSV